MCFVYGSVSYTVLSGVRISRAFYHVADVTYVLMCAYVCVSSPTTPEHRWRPPDEVWQSADSHDEHTASHGDKEHRAAAPIERLPCVIFLCFRRCMGTVRQKKVPLPSLIRTIPPFAPPPGQRKVVVCCAPCTSATVSSAPCSPPPCRAPHVIRYLVERRM